MVVAQRGREFLSCEEGHFLSALTADRVSIQKPDLRWDDPTTCSSHLPPACLPRGRSGVMCNYQQKGHKSFSRFSQHSMGQVAEALSSCAVGTNLRAPRGHEAEQEVEVRPWELSLRLFLFEATLPHTESMEKS